jgi:hypothetical protein
MQVPRLAGAVSHAAGTPTGRWARRALTVENGGKLSLSELLMEVGLQSRAKRAAW